MDAFSPAPRRKLLAAFLVILLLALFRASGQSQQGQGIDDLHRAFANPPDSSRIMMRWWWFGPAAEKSEITRELEQMKSAGIGGAEIATLYPLALDNPATGFHNTPFLSPEHLDSLKWAAHEAHRLGLRLDITLGDGWPFGGPHIPVTQAAGKLRVDSIDIPAGATSSPAPFIDAGEELLAAFLIPQGASPSDISKTLAIPTPIGGHYSFASASSARRLLCFVSSRTGMAVKRPAAGGEGFVLDHYDRAAIENHLSAVGDKLLSAFGDNPPYAVFSDSLEDYASDWTPALLQEFQRRRGYDLRPHLLKLVMDAGPDTAAVRHDWGQTLTELADENFLQPIHAWAKQHHTLLRSQSYGYPPVTLSSNRYEDLPEGEGKATFRMWREFSDTRWAASAGHLYHHSVISSETWTWLHSPAFRATPLDMKVEADLHFLQGINQLVGHGWPYSPPSEPNPGWRMYAAAAFDAHNPWFFAMPDLTRYLQRVSFALRQGEPANDVAMLLPNDDVWSSFKAGLTKRLSPTSAAGFDESGSNVSVDESMPNFLGDKVIAQVLDAGFNLDFIDADAIAAVGIPYKILILPGVDRLPVATYEKIAAFAQAGGIVVATRRLPSQAPGFMNAQEQSARINQISRQLFHGNDAKAHFVESESQLGATLAKLASPDMTLSPSTPAVGFIHRKLSGGDLYFVANTSNQVVKGHAHFRSSASHAEAWDSMSGETYSVRDPQNIVFNLEPYESRLIYFASEGLSAPVDTDRSFTPAVDLSHDWKIKFESTDIVAKLDHFSSWTDNPQTQFFSGRATYEKAISLQLAGNPPDTKYILDFGPGTPEPVPSPPGKNNMRAYLVPPVREAAEVFVNGSRAGAVWHPPFRIDVTPYLHNGENSFRIVVGNTAINELAGQTLPDYRLLWARYGMRFVPQDMHDLRPLPSGILGALTLLRSNRAR